MKLPASLENLSEWTLVGPMGPEIPEKLLTFPVLCVDGGARFCQKMDVWVGDGDSQSDPVNCENIFTFPSKKSASDLALTLSLFKPNQAIVRHLWGFLGGRKDHETINFGEVIRFLEKHPNSEAIFYSNNEKIELKCLGSGEWPFDYNGTFSVACIKSSKIKIIGSCLYPLEKEIVLEPLSSLGLSNMGSGKFTLHNEGPVMIFFPENE